MGSTCSTPATLANRSAPAGPTRAPGDSMTVTSAPLVRRASTSACCRYVELNTAVDNAKDAVKVTSTSARQEPSLAGHGSRHRAAKVAGQGTDAPTDQAPAPPEGPVGAA